MSCDKVIVVKEQDEVLIVQKNIEKITQVVSAGPQGPKGDDAAGLTAEELKQLYESNPDTNAFTDAEQTKLANIEDGATEGADWEVNLINIPEALAYSHIHRQLVASDTWSIIHNLNKRPTVAITDSAGEEVYGTITHISNNQLEISFSAAFSGEAYLV